MSTNHLVPSNVVTEIVAQRDAALAKVSEALTHIASAAEAMRAANTYANGAHQGRRFHGLDRTSSVHFQRLDVPAEVSAEASLEAYRQHLDAAVWTHLMERTGMEALMDRQAKDEFYQGLCASVPPVTEDNIWHTLSGLAGDATLIFQRGLARAFIALDRRFRSHDAFKLGDRVILTNVFDAWGAFNIHTRMRETITDLERVFLVLDNERDTGAPLAVGSLVQQIGRDRGYGMDPRQSVTESRYFRVRGFKNGNAHLWFTRDDLVQKANETLADYYGSVLPDAVPEDVSGDAVRSYALSTDLAFYPTPPAVITAMLRNTYIERDARVLEPSAGDGAIVREVLKTGARVDAVEVHPTRVAALRGIQRNHPNGARLNVQEANFLHVPAAPIYDYVVMNPPFCGTHWMAHVRHAFDFLKPGGMLHAVLPVSAELGTSAKHEAFRAWAATLRMRYAGSPFSDLPAESFAPSGTRVSTVVFCVGKPLR